MNYLKFGTSSDYMVFLHGWGADKNSFLWIKDNFPDKSLVFVDFAGFGETSEPSKPYSLSDYVMELKNLLDNFKIDSLTLVGHSFGGRVALKFAFLFQNEYDLKLCLVDSAGIKPKRNLKYYFRFYRFKFYKKFFPNSPKIDNFGSIDYKKLSKIMKLTFIKIVNEDLSSISKFIHCKTLIIWGENDRETKIYMAKKLNKNIKNSTLKIIKNAGHYSFLDNPFEFTNLLDSFVCLK